MLSDTVDRVATFDGQQDLCRHIIKHFVHLPITNSSVSVKNIVIVLFQSCLLPSLGCGCQ